MSHFWRTLQIFNNSSKQTKKLAHSSHYALFGPQFMGHTVWTTVCAVTFWAPLPWCKRDGRGGFLFCVRKLSRCYSLLERVESHSFVARRIILLWCRLINRQRSMVKPFCANSWTANGAPKTINSLQLFCLFYFSVTQLRGAFALLGACACDRSAIPNANAIMNSGTGGDAIKTPWIWYNAPNEYTRFVYYEGAHLHHQPSPFWVASTR